MTTIDRTRSPRISSEIRSLILLYLHDLNPLNGGFDPNDPGSGGGHLPVGWLLSAIADDGWEGPNGSPLGPDDGPLPDPWGPHGPIIRQSLSGLALVDLASRLSDQETRRSVLMEAAQVLSAQSAQLQQAAQE